MMSQAWLDFSLRRSARLAQEVLERASRRAVDWNNTGLTRTSSTAESTDTESNLQKTHTESDAFATVAGSMASVASQCASFYESGCCTEPSDNERRHLSRFHQSPGSGKITPATTPDNTTRPSSLVEDFDVDVRVSPGTYAVTASTADSEQQTMLVSLKAGESYKLTFNF